MSDSTTLTFLLLLFTGAQFTLLGFMSYWLGKNKRFNYRAFGFKTHSTLSNPEVWAVISKDAGLAFMLEGIATLIVTIAFREFILRHYIAFFLTFLGVNIVIVIVFAIRASKMARQLAEGTEMDISNAFCDRR